MHPRAYIYFYTDGKCEPSTERMYIALLYEIK